MIEKEQPKFEVLISALEGDINIYQKSNLHCSCIIANQSNDMSYYENENIKIISTNTRGLAKNRNISLLYVNSQYFLFGDDDVQYVDDLEDIIVSSFEKNKKADLLIFNIITVGSDLIKRRINKSSKRVTTFNYMNYGSVRIACRTESIKKKNIWFSDMFGSGAKYSSGEDTIFLADCLKNKLKIYTAPIIIGTVDQSKSTWFNGYTEKYFFDKGAVMGCIYPINYRLFCLYFALKMRTKERGFKKTYDILIKGAKNFLKKTNN